MTRPAILALAAGIAGFALLALGAHDDARRAASAYLVAYAFALSVPLGALATAMVCDACGAVWFVPLRRCAEGFAATLPALALLFAPVLMSLALLYPWAGPPPADLHLRELLAGRRGYLDPAGFALRAALCFACWIALAELMRRWSLRQERPPHPDLSRRRRALAAAGLLPLLATITVAAIDWYLSLDAAWRSTIYGMLHAAGDAVAGMAALALAWRWAERRGRLVPGPGTGPGPEHAHALGNLLFTAVLLWSYLAFMQLLVVWMADLPDEAGWYVPRLRGGWGAYGLALLALHAALPFAVLLSRAAKRDLPTLAGLGALLLLAHHLDLWWQLMPTLRPTAPRPHWTDVAALLAVGGCTAALGLWRAHGLAAVPQGDPDLADGLAYRSAP
jgi:hypothetical protein